MSLADGMRWFCAGTALLLVFACVYCIFYSRTWDQRLRFGSTCLIAVVIVAGQLASLGNDSNWRMPVLTVGVALNLVGAVVFARRTARAAGSEHKPGS